MACELALSYGCGTGVQNFAQYRGKLSMKSEAEIRALSETDTVWTVVGMLNYLQALVDKSHIADELRAPGAIFLNRAG